MNLESRQVLRLEVESPWKTVIGEARGGIISMNMESRLVFRLEVE